MKISSLANYTDDLELRWLKGVGKTTDGKLCVDTFFRQKNGSTFFWRLPYGTLPFLMPGLVISSGEVLTSRKGGKSGWAVIPDLSQMEVIPAIKAFTRDHYDLGGHFGGDHSVLRYHSRGWTILIPAMELVRFLFLHSKVMAKALLEPMGLMNLALTPVPDFYPEILIEFHQNTPRALMRPEFVQEFAWAAVHPEGRAAWDSVRRLSSGQRTLILEPPPLKNCRIEFRGVAKAQTWLVLEINALSGRALPAPVINWTHPSVCEKNTGPERTTVAKNEEDDLLRPARPVHVREHEVDEEADSQKDINQDMILLGGKRGMFTSPARVVRILSPPRARQTVKETGDQEPVPRKSRSDTGRPVDPALPVKIVSKTVSLGEESVTGGLSPLEVLTLEPASFEAIGDLGLLIETLKLIEQSQPDLTLTVSLVFLKPGQSVSRTPQGRRICLVAVFTSPVRPPFVVLDIDHSELAGDLSGLMLRYDLFCQLDEMDQHIKQLLDTMVDRYGSWDKEAERTLPKWVAVKRLPKLLRMTERAGDMDYVEMWVRRLKERMSK